jgi:hypothetical protein
MMAMMSFATLVIATLLATGIAVLLDWLMLRVAFQLLQPVAKRAVTPQIERGELARGTVQLVRVYGAHRFAGSVVV